MLKNLYNAMLYCANWIINMFIIFWVWIFYIFNLPAMLAFWLLTVYGVELKFPERNKVFCRVSLAIIASIFSVGAYFILYLLGIYNIFHSDISD